MKRVYHLMAAIILLIIAVSGCSVLRGNNDVLFQTSTIDALLAGVYDGDRTIGELKKHGDFGIGTFDDLDGEMVMLGGEVYQVKADGKVYSINDSMETPFAAVTFFETDKVIGMDKVSTFEQMVQYFDSILPTKNVFYAVKIDGLFEYIKTRSVPRQNKPYPPLAEVVKTQPIFEFRGIEGTVVGFRCPSYVNGVNVPGYHLHFIARDKKSGGHVLELQMQNARVELDNTPEFYMALPQSREFYQLDLTKGKQTELDKVEKGSANN
jgi:acetolactate decarboxylase